MAKIIVDLVLDKLSGLSINEAFFCFSFYGKVEQVRRELILIRGFMNNANAKRRTDERVRSWVNEVTNVGFLTNDALDQVLVEIREDQHTRNIFKRIAKGPMKMIAMHKFHLEIDKIQKMMREISEKYDISWEDYHQGDGDLPFRPIYDPNIDETEVIGFEVYMKEIVEELIDTNVLHRFVISIVGAGGLGKTTLARAVYNRDETKRHFDIRLWVAVPKHYRMKNILIEMLRDIGADDYSEMQYLGVENLITKLYNFMKEKKYLVVLDDVWSRDLWAQLCVALPKNYNGSRVLITTRFNKIVEVADEKYKQCEMKTLNEEESQQLLMKKIFSKYECPENLLPLAFQFAKKCGGWPLALLVMGDTLSVKDPNYDTWNEVMQEFDWHSDGRKFMDVISTSYEDLPIHLKICFMYFAVFPEDYQIKATDLIQLWVAEGYIIALDGPRTAEDLAEDYLEELVWRCMVKVSSRSATTGKIKYCHVHNLLRELATLKAREDNFLMVFSTADNQWDGKYSALGVSLHDCDSKPLEHAYNNLRTLHCFGDCLIHSWEGLRFLRVLNIPNQMYRVRSNGGVRMMPFFNYDKKWLKNLTTLTYLRFETGTCHESEPFNPEYGSLLKPSHLTYMTNIQTVNMSLHCGSNECLPVSFWENKMLKDVTIVPCDLCNKLAVELGPPSSANLVKLLTLKQVAARKEWCTKLPHFPRLRKLGLFIPDGVDPEPIVNSLSNQQDLRSLSVENGIFNKLPEFPGGTKGFRNQNELYSLHFVNGMWPMHEAVDSASILPPNLLKLDLSGFVFGEDPMPRLEKLPRLKILKLSGIMRMADENQRVTCSMGGFECLERLVFHAIGFEEWKIEEGAMPELKQLAMAYGNDLKEVPDFQYLTKLQELEVESIAYVDNTGLKGRLQPGGDNHGKIAHIPTVTYK